MKDRVAQNPNRYQITPIGGGDPYTVDIVRADNPVEEGTPWNVASVLRDATALLYGLQPDAVPDDVFATIGDLLNKLNAFSAGGITVPIESGGTGARTAQAARQALGLSATDTVTFARVLGAVYQ